MDLFIITTMHNEKTVHGEKAVQSINVIAISVLKGQWRDLDGAIPFRSEKGDLRLLYSSNNTILRFTICSSTLASKRDGPVTGRRELVFARLM